MDRLIAYFARQGFFAVLILIYTIAMGIYVTFIIQKEAFPNVQYDIIIIRTIFPGASPTETEKLITNPLEFELKEVIGIKRLVSQSVEGLSTIFIEVDADQTTLMEARQDIQEVIDRFAFLPDGAEDPLVISMDSATQIPIIQLAITADEGIDPLKHREIARFIEKEMEKIPDVASIETYGIGDLEIHVEANPRRLSFYQLTLANLVKAIADQNKAIPGGILEQQTSKGKKEILVRTVSEYEDVEDVEKTVVRSNDLVNAIQIKDVAKVSYGLEKATTLFRGNGRPSIFLTLMKKETSDTIKLVDTIKKRIKELGSRLPDNIQVQYIDDQSYFIKRRLNVLLNNLSIGLILVLFILSLFFPIKIAFLTAIGIPFALLGTLLFFSATGMSLNLLTMMGLIIVLGMLVDDAVVVIENTMRFIEKGYPPKEAAIQATCQIWQPVTAAVSTTIMVFLPLMFMSGIFGRFVAFLPLGVLAGLALSLFECFFILPHHVSFLAKNHSLAKTKKRKTICQKMNHIWNIVFLRLYEKILRWTLKRRYVSIFFILVLFTCTGLLMKNKMHFVLFPPDDIEIFIVKAEAPVGTPLQETVSLMRPVEEAVANLDKTELRDYVTHIGMQIANSPFDPDTKLGSHLGLVIVYLTTGNERTRTPKQIIEGLREKIKIPPGIENISFEQLSGGPPVGRAIHIGVRSDEYEHILPAVEELKTFIAQIKGTSDITDTYDTGKEELHVKVQQAEALAAQLSIEDIGLSVRAAFEGIEATYIQKVDEEVAIRVTWPGQLKQSRKNVRQLNIPNAFGNLIPITSVASFGTYQGLSSIMHEGHERQVEILGDVDTNITTSVNVNNQVRDVLPSLREKFPYTSFFFGGEDRDTQESLQSLARAFVVAILGVFLILVLIFQNLSQPTLVLLVTVPLGVVAVMWTLFLHSMPISFMACLGIIALSGVIVNNAIVFTSFVNDARNRGADNIQSILDAGKLRLRPIFLTTLTTVAGILPTAYGLGGLDPFLVPIALALGWGMFFGSFLTTLLFPSCLAVLDDLVWLVCKILRIHPSKD